ncbi:MAG: GNAT family N-acetyltransferase [Planctomycetes bacterium]|nr:GNAT family N-acetyltransferase [Planctomycetota bacterium]
MLDISRAESIDSVPSRTWNEVVASSATRSVFQTHEWHRAWWNVHGSDKTLWLLLAHDGGKLVGILAATRDEHGDLLFIGHRRSDYVDVICPDDREDVREALLERLVREAQPWRRFELRNLPEASPTAKTLERLGLRTLLRTTTPCPTLVIHGHEDFFDEVRRKKSLRRHHNWFKKQDGYEVLHTHDASEIARHLDAFFEQHVQRWQDTDSPSLFSDDESRRFYREVLDTMRGTTWLRFTTVSAMGKPVAFHFGFVHDGVFVWYKPSFDIDLQKKSPGEALIKELFELAHEEGCTEFDFTVGDETFKSRFSNLVRSNLYITAYGGSLDYWRQRMIEGAKRRLKSSTLGQRLIEKAKKLGRT